MKTNIPIYRAKKIESDKVILFDTDELSVGSCNELLQDGWIDTKQDQYFRKNINDEWVEGYLHIIPETVDIAYADIEKGNYIFSNIDGITAWEIDQNTLAIHFPNTNEWYSMEEMQNIIKRHEDGNMATH